LKPLVFPDRITVLHKIQPLQENNPDNFTLEVIILSEKHRRVAARCVEDIVIYDYKAGSKAPMPEWVYQVMVEVQNEQTEWQKKCLARLQELDKAISTIETQNGY
jgi:acyl-CoA thioesterase FadM